MGPVGGGAHALQFSAHFPLQVPTKKRASALASPPKSRRGTKQCGKGRSSTNPYTPEGAFQPTAIESRAPHPSGAGEEH